MINPAWLPNRFVHTLALLLAAGCGGNDGPDRFQLSGAVTYGGKPIPAGKVVIEPDASQGNSGPQAQASITEGTYETQPTKGAIAGPVIIRVRGFDGKGNQKAGLPMGTPLFTPYETSATLPEDDSTFDIEVPDSHE